ncbi:hypothetical protein FGO68_gene2847 [Halteria grandinella]|uniref:Uncharacterized protein n=1 Tax=Halteria grandinella TaxID=5974 RepID=A0A8J8NPA4_HALGN|nr:hypothetical protein FGO68_gene2847 [Halteria grandinella]
METEDALSWVYRERQKCEQRMQEAAELSRLVEEQHQRLNFMVLEKQEAVKAMEISIREQVKQAENRLKIVKESNQQEKESLLKLREEINQERSELMKDYQREEHVYCDMPRQIHPEQSEASSFKPKRKKGVPPRYPHSSNNSFISEDVKLNRRLESLLSIGDQDCNQLDESLIEQDISDIDGNLLKLLNKPQQLKMLR